MLNQQFYGRMRPNPPVQGGPVLVPCDKCGGQFSLEKKHHEVYVVGAYFGRTKEGTLTPATPISEKFARLCPGCFEELKRWFTPNGAK